MVRKRARKKRVRPRTRKAKRVKERKRKRVVKKKPKRLRALVTGASGRVGSALIRRLMEEGYIVRALVRNVASAERLPDGIEVAFGDIGDLESLRGAFEKVDTVFHLAATIDYKAGKAKLHEVNARGTVNVITEAHRFKVKRLVYASSIAVYGKGERSGPVRESDGLEPTDDYGSSKLEGEIAVRHSNLPYCVLRIGLVYGPGFDEAYIPLMKMLEKRRMPYVGSGVNSIPFVHVDDVVSAFVLAGGKKGDGIYNIVGERVTQKEAFDLVCEFMGVGRPRMHASPSTLMFMVKVMNVFNRLVGRRPKLVEEYIEALATERRFDTSRAREELGWKPQVGIREGIEGMVEYYKGRKG